MQRMYLYMFDHNVRKHYRINNRELRRMRHAQVAGADLEYLRSLVGGFFDRRMFRPSGLGLSEPVRMKLNREWKTPLKEKPKVLWKYLTA